MQQPGSSRSNTNPFGKNSGWELLPGATFEDQPLWKAIGENLRDALFSSRLPPLELTSEPIPVADRMAARFNPWALGTATVINGGIVALAVLLGMRTFTGHYPPPHTGDPIHIGDLRIFAPATPKSADGGNGGGTNDRIDPIEGRNPKFANAPIAPPMVPLIQQPKLAAESAIDIHLPDNSTLPNIGVQSSTNVRLASNGQGSHGGQGTGADGGSGPGNGNDGWGPGSGKTIYVPGHGVIAPTVVYAPEAEFSDEARHNKYQGVCMVSVIVDTRGNPQNAHVIRWLGMGLDEKALQAVHGYRFKPGTKDGKPVPVEITVEVDFRMF
jgi:TonB family protein